MKSSRSGEKVKLTSIDELLGVMNEESAMEIELKSITPFRSHPFKVLNDEKMEDLINSIKENGVITPVLIRPTEKNHYEMISGHRRLYAARKAGLGTIPAIVRELSDDEAVIAMVDANIQREELLPSEKAFAYKMKLEAMKHQGGRTDITSGQNGQKLERIVSRDVLAEQVGESSKQIQRYIRLTELIPELLDMVDNKKIQFTVAVDISYIDKEMQKWIYEYIRDNGFIKPNQIAVLRKRMEDENVGHSYMISILNNCITPKKNRKVTLPEKKLNHDELMIIGCFYEGSKEETILLLEDIMNVLKEVRMDESDDEMIQLLKTAIEKLKKMDEAAFASLDLQKYLNDLQEDQEND